MNWFIWGSNSFPTRRKNYRFPAQNHGIRLRGAGSHPSCFTLNCKLLQCFLKIMVWQSRQNHIICKKHRSNSEVPRFSLAASWDRFHVNYKRRTTLVEANTNWRHVWLLADSTDTALTTAPATHTPTSRYVLFQAFSKTVLSPMS